MQRCYKEWSWMILLLCLLVFGGSILGYVRAAGDPYEAVGEGFNTFGAVYKKIYEGYVQEEDPKALISAAIDGMLEKLDPYTQFLDQKLSIDQLKIDTTGEYGGLGISIDMKDGVPIVISPFEGTPAYNVGLRAGDRIVKIEGEPTKGKTLDEVVSILRGPPGTSVTITVEREGDPYPSDYVMVRDLIKLKAVTLAEKIVDDGRPEEGIGYVRLAKFSQVAGDELEDALRELQRQGIKGLILDLRANPGGLLPQACDVADKFLKKGQRIVSTKGRQVDQNRDYSAQNDPVLNKDIPLVVLVNQGSASASEIVAGAIQDHDRGLIVGKPTFGKGSVQTIQLINETARLKLTTALYYTPSGRSIHRPERGHINAETDSIALREHFLTDHGRTVYGGGGISPDIEVEAISLTRLTRALERQRTFFDFAVHYAVVHPDLNENVEVDDKVLAEFEAYVSSPEVGFEYPFAGQPQMQELEKIVEEEGYGEDVKAAVAVLKSVLKQQKKTDFAQNRDYIRMAIRREMASRMWGSEARLRATFPEDPQLQKAIELLKDPVSYSRKMEETSVAIGKREAGVQ